MNCNPWARLLAYATGLVNQELLLQNEYSAAENRILLAHLPAQLRLSDPERRTLAEIGKRVGRKPLEKVACVAKPDTILAWFWATTFCYVAVGLVWITPNTTQKQEAAIRQDHDPVRLSTGGDAVLPHFPG